MSDLTDLIAALRADQEHAIDAYNALWHTKAQLEAELARAHAEVAGMCETTAQMERQIAAETAARLMVEADAAQLRCVLDILSRAGDLASVRNVASAALARMRPGAALLNELAILRELAADVQRWRETGGDPRDVRYILETMDRYYAMKGEGE